MVLTVGSHSLASTYFCDLVGIDYDKIDGKSCLDFFFPEDVHEARRLFERIQSLEAEPLRFRLRRLDGKPVWVDIQHSAFRHDGAVNAISATVTVAPGAEEQHAERK